MPSKKMTGKTPLTESQARTLALWWGGDCVAQTLPGENGSQLLHGVKFPQPRPWMAAPPSAAGDTFWFQEEAREWENRRNCINPGAEAWMG
jgi:hypothetical protein